MPCIWYLEPVLRRMWRSLSLRTNSMETLAAFVIFSLFSDSNAVGGQLGGCDTGPWSHHGLCDGLGVVHVYAASRVSFSARESVVLSAHHFSRYDGEADLTGDMSGQTPKFEYAGIGYEYRW